MRNRKRPVVVATRVNREDRVLLEAAAALEDVSVCEFIYRTVMPVVHELLAPRVRTEQPHQVSSHSSD